MTTTRRGLFKFAAGGAAGLLFTPAPWRLITDAALWSENWPGIPQPARGELRVRYTHCAMCPAGCAVRARCVGDQPISLTGLPGAPLCAFGLTGHHLPYHRDRVIRGDAPAAMREIQAAISHRRAGESVAVLDLRPGRTASWTYRRAMAVISRGVYVAPQSVLPPVNLEAVNTILSFGVPVLDGWGTPAKILAARQHFRLIQAEPTDSHTAVLADEWLPIRRGTEADLALGIAYMLSGSASGIPPAEAAHRTGVPEWRITSVARDLARGNALVVAAEESAAVMSLNALAGATKSVLVGRRETPRPRSWRKAVPVTPIDSVPDRSVRVLLIDETAVDAYLPWTVVEPKLTEDCLVATFASSRAGYGQHAKLILPAAVYPETTDDIPAAVDSPVAVFRLATPLVSPPGAVVNPSRFVADLAGFDATNALRERAHAVYTSGAGKLHSYAGSQCVPMKEVAFDEFWKTLNEGGCWTDDPGRTLPAPEWHPPTARGIVAMTWEMRGARGPMSPLVSKWYEESNLRVRL